MKHFPASQGEDDDETLCAAIERDPERPPEVGYWQFLAYLHSLGALEVWGCTPK